MQLPDSLHSEDLVKSARENKSAWVKAQTYETRGINRERKIHHASNSWTVSQQEMDVISVLEKHRTIRKADSGL